MISKRERLRRIESEIEKIDSQRIVDEQTRSIPDDPVEFCRKTLRFQPTDYQVKFLQDKSQFIVLRWSRQSGKTFIVAAKILWFLLKHPYSTVGTIAPSFRQSKMVINKINSLLPRIPGHLVKRSLKTEIEFSNNSRIEAFPNNSETIRGPTLSGIYCDEMNFIRDDEEIYDAILFTLGTTNGWLICSSTPWAFDSVFYRICTDPDYSDFSRHHITWREAVEPNGPLKRQILEKIKRQLQSDPWRWQREMEADWAEGDDCYYPQALITRCIDPDLEFIDESWLVTRA